MGIFVFVFLLLIFSISFCVADSNSQYKTGKKNIILTYIVDGERGGINFEVYEGVVDYLESLPINIVYYEDEETSLADFKLKHLDEEIQREFLMPLVDKIREKTDNKLEQVRIAISLVQNIKYGKSDKIIIFNSKQETGYSRYPYEVLYDQEGLCGEKSELLIFLLKELDYGVGIFRYLDENHEVVAVSCPKKYSINNSGYCFVETTAPSVATDDSIIYVGGIELESTPLLYELYEGDSLEKGMYEYKDAKTMEKIRNSKFMFFRKWRLNRLNKKYGLVNEYNLD